MSLKGTYLQGLQRHEARDGEPIDDVLLGRGGLLPLPPGGARAGGGGGGVGAVLPVRVGGEAQGCPPHVVAAPHPAAPPLPVPLRPGLPLFADPAAPWNIHFPRLTRQEGP